MAPAADPDRRGVSARMVRRASQGRRDQPPRRRRPGVTGILGVLVPAGVPVGAGAA